MHIFDKIYGDFEINERVLIELINSHVLERLKGISQFGPPAEFYHLPVFSRHDHSLGVMLLLRKLGADLEEQIAGLLHDASHTAFSHVIDHLFGDPSKEDYQDNNHLSILLKFDVKKILEKYNFDVYKIASLENFPILEREAPALCADRLDYALRELHMLGKADNAIQCALSLKILNGAIVFDNFERAKEFALAYMERNREHWTGFEAVSRYHQLSLILKEALDKNFIQLEDMWQTDDFVIKKLYQNGGESITSALEQMKNKKTQIRFGIVKSKKFRFVDPKILVGGYAANLSELDKEYGRLLESERQGNAAGMEI
ncbi:MAG: HD domain-containing protein [Patescibacteria group bacterium]